MGYNIIYDGYIIGTHTHIYIDIIPRRFIGFYGFYCNEMEWDIRYN